LHLVPPDNSSKTKHVETLWVSCLDEGSSPSSSTMDSNGEGTLMGVFAFKSPASSEFPAYADSKTMKCKHPLGVGKWNIIIKSMKLIVLCLLCFFLFNTQIHAEFEDSIYFENRINQIQNSHKAIKSELRELEKNYSHLRIDEDSIYFESIINQMKMDQSHLQKEISELTNNKSIEQKQQRNNLLVSLISLGIAFSFLIATIENNRKNQKTINILSEQMQMQGTSHSKLIEAQQGLVQQQNAHYKQQIEIAKGNIKPIIITEKVMNNKQTSLTMTNHGGGPAVISKIEFIKGRKSVNTISKLIDVKKIHPLLDWESRWISTQKKYYLSPHQTRTLYKITSDYIVNDCHLSESDASRIIQAIKKLREGIYVKITYTDILNTNGDTSLYETYKYHLGIKQP